MGLETGVLSDIAEVAGTEGVGNEERLILLISLEPLSKDAAGMGFLTEKGFGDEVAANT
jgi:hypothetical protein